MRDIIIAGNWKMNLTITETKRFINQLLEKLDTKNVKTYIIPPFLSIETLKELTKDKEILVGAQNFFYKDVGAYTGEISIDMLKDLSVDAVIIGHSERREIFFESDEVVNKKILKALEKDVTPIICCGENLETRKCGAAKEFIKNQINKAFLNVEKEDAKKCIIAYEPIWAIGTGEVASVLEAEEICETIRKKIKELYDDEVAQNIHILYGGSVNATNCYELFLSENIDGGLIGGASLKMEFADIVECGRKINEK